MAPPADPDQARAQDALALASRLHTADRRQREPYAHFLRVAIRILSHYRVDDPDVACAALLPDAVEDRCYAISYCGPILPLQAGVKDMVARQPDRAESRFASILD